MEETKDYAAFYDAQPWAGEWGPGVPKEPEPLPYRNMAELIRRASIDYAGNTAFTICLDNGMDASLKYHEVDQLSDRFAAYLRRELGLAAGDRVAVQMPNCLSFPIAAFGILKAGCVLVNVNPLYTAHEMNHQFKDSGASVLVIIDMFADKLEEALKGTDIKKVLTVSIAEFFPAAKRTLLKTVLKLKGMVPKTTVTTTPFAEALALGAKQLGKGPIADLGNRAPDDTAVLQYTGGTTGVAKGAELMHSNLLANVAQVITLSGPVMRYGEETVMTALPLYHIFAFSFNLLGFYVTGNRNILIPSPRPVSNLRKAFEKFEINKFAGVNILFQGLLNEEWFRNNPPKKLDLTISGGTALHSSVAAKWQEVVGSQILEGYGLSETSPTLSVNPVQGENRIGTIGVPVPGTIIRIVDENDNPVAPGEVGEIVAKGPQVMRGYWNRPDESAKALKGGWFHTGDMGYMDERGYIKVVDRKKDMIDVSGFNVYPNEVEDCLSAHEDIMEVAVIGVPNATGGETVRAYIVSRNPSLKAEDVIAFARERLTAYKVPKEIIFRDELPKTPVGKILRKDLRQEALQEANAA